MIAIGSPIVGTVELGFQAVVNSDKTAIFNRLMAGSPCAGIGMDGEIT